MTLPSKIINLTLSSDMLLAIDNEARARFTSRSAFIRECITLRLNNQHITTETVPPDPQTLWPMSETGPYPSREFNFFND